MPTQVYLFLPPLPAHASYYRERHPFGPDPAVMQYHTDLGIEIDPQQADTYGRALAVVSGLMRFIPDPNQITGTMVLKPDGKGLKDISTALGSTSTLIFAYRNLDRASVEANVLPIIRTMSNTRFLTSDTPEHKATLFAAGGFPISISAGKELGKASTTGGRDGWALLGFEIVYAPGGLGPDRPGSSPEQIGWNRLKELTDPSSLSRRFNPMAFYALISASTDATLATEHRNHVLLSLPSLRTLIEVRDEYDLPFGDEVTIQKGNIAPVSQAPTAGSRGTFVMDALPSGATGPLNTISYSVTIPRYVLTPLPSGLLAGLTLERTMQAPAHWAMQAIYKSATVPQADEPKSWFVENTPLARYTEHNKVIPIVDGLDVFRAYVEAMRTVTGTGHFMYLAAWELQDQFPLMPGDSPRITPAVSSVQALLRRADASVPSGTELRIRAMLWDQLGGANSAQVDRINALPGGHGQAILDNDTALFGSHHQKFLVINGSLGAFAFCGGIDIATNRRDSPHHGAPGPWHDVQAKVEGPAVADLHRTFVDRWNNHPDRGRFPRLDEAAPPFTSDVGSVFVQVARTYPCAHPPAQQGSITPLNAFLRAITKAKKFIYIEDQYLTPYPFEGPDIAAGPGDTVGILTALRGALQNIDYLLMLIPNYTDHPQNRLMRKQFINALRAVAADKVHVFYLYEGPGTTARQGEVADEGGCSRCSGNPSSAHRNEIYVHSKVWIVDDICAKIGSANCNRRSYTYDSELDIVMVDGAVSNGARSFAQNLRLQLWGEHLRMQNDPRLEDHKVALSFWLANAGRVRPYQQDIPDDPAILNLVPWSQADPEGRCGMPS